MSDNKTNILIIGAGKGGSLLIDLFYKSMTVNIIGVVDINADAPGIKLAGKFGIPTAADYKEFLNNKDLNEIFNVTGSEKVQEDLLRLKPSNVEVIGGHSAKLIWDLIEERKQVEEKLLYLSTRDALTGLYNRTYFEEEMARLELGRQFPVSIIMVDVNGLKTINDRDGHVAGDEMLRRTGYLLKASVRVEDMVARIGGDEFAVLLKETDALAAEGTLTRINNNIKIHNDDYNGPSLSLSLGLATGDRGSLLAIVLKEADKNMYKDKQLRKS
ncbi:MAG: hypothetical protein A2Y97_11505 [Nitrospirae bacterium RBG_13_39_12]|nr:MAG: hypothetical protein A2Y97_11505 [Nitrospirae bacterium RBG_13_39_12]